MSRPWEHIHAAHFLNLVASCLENLNVPGKTCRLAGNVYYLVDAKIDDFVYCLRVDAVPWRVKNDHVGLVLDIVYYFKNIAGNKFAVVKTVKAGVFPGGNNSLLNDFNTNNLFCDWCKNLGDGAGTAVKVEYKLVVYFSYKYTAFGVKHLCSKRVCLEKRKRCYFKLKTEKFLVYVILAVKDFSSLINYRVCKGIVYGM